MGGAPGENKVAGQAPRSGQRIAVPPACRYLPAMDTEPPADRPGPLDDVRALLAALPPGNDAAAERTKATLARAGGGFGQVGEAAAWLARWSGSVPQVVRPAVVLFAGTQAIAPGLAAVGTQAVELSAAGATATSQLCAASDLGLKVLDLALDHPTEDFSLGEALDPRGAAATVAFGMEGVAGKPDLLAIGDCGGATALSAAACFTLLEGGVAADWLDTDPLPFAAAVDRGAALHAAAGADPLSLLGRIGGRESAAIAGAILAARMEKVPVLLDGFAALSAALVLQSASPGAIDHCLFVEAGPGARARMLGRLGAHPPLALGVTHGEGLGAALAATVLRSAARMLAGLGSLR